MKRYFWNVLISIDQLLNTILGPLLNLIFNVSDDHKFGDPDETLSSVFGKNSERCKACWCICMFLNKFQKEHCKRSIEYKS